MSKRANWQLYKDRKIEELENQLEEMSQDPTVTMDALEEHQELLAETRNQTFEDDYADHCYDEWKARRNEDL